MGGFRDRLPPLLIPLKDMCINGSQRRVPSRALLGAGSSGLRSMGAFG